MIAEVQSKRNDFHAVKIQHTSRSCNAMAHSLAKLELERSESIVWVGSYPSEIMYLLNLLVE